ncbi:MAG: hypothetical protein OXC99_10820 [Chloroflexi bacterium]|nr:hypothetical protein [Chloroflexota bacterium]
MEQLPRGAQFQRSKMLWEIALGIAGDPNIRYYEDRDVSIVIGNGSGEAFTPALRMAPGSPALAHAVARGDLDLAFVNPSAMLTQAYRGTGLYSEPLPVRVIASYPSYDRFVAAVQPRLGGTSLAGIAGREAGPRAGSRRCGCRCGRTRRTRRGRCWTNCCRCTASRWTTSCRGAGACSSTGRRGTLDGWQGSATGASTWCSTRGYRRG